MTHHHIKHTVTYYHRKLKKHYKIIVKKFDTETIHEFRVNYKKLRAFLRMLSQKDNKAGKLKVSKKLKKTYHCLGSIRDLQLQRVRILEASKYEREIPMSYRIILQKEIRRYTDKLDAINLNNNHLADSKKVNAFLSHKFPLRLFKDFVKDTWAAIYAIILSENFSDKNIHLIRKHLKDLFYNLKEYEKTVNKNLSKSVLRGKDEPYFDRVLEDLGSFHDKCTAISLLRADLINNLNNEILIRIKQAWIGEKLIMKNLLVNKLNIEIPTELPTNSPIYRIDALPIAEKPRV